MWRILVSSLLLAVAAGLPQSGFSSALDIADGYLPPPNPDNPTPNSVRCEDPKTIYKTETQRVTKTVFRNVVKSVPQVIQKTAIVTKVVPSVVDRSSVSRVQSPVVVTQVDKTVVQRLVTETINVPGNIRVVTETNVQNQISYKTEQRVITSIAVVTTTQVQSSRVVQRVTETVRQVVPQVVYVTKTVQVPGGVRVVTKTEQRQVNSVQQYQPPAVTSVRNEVKYVTSVVVRQVPGPVINLTKNVVRNQVIQKTSVQRVPQVSTTIIQQNREVVRTETKFNQVTSTQVKYVTETQQVPIIVTKTQERLVTVPLVLTKTETVVRSVPGPDVVRNVVRNEDRVKTVRGPDRITTVYKNINRVVTEVVTSIQIRPSLVTQVVVRSEPCEGYNYDAPSNPLTF